MIGATNTGTLDFDRMHPVIADFSQPSNVSINGGVIDTFARVMYDTPKVTSSELTLNSEVYVEENGQAVPFIVADTSLDNTTCVALLRKELLPARQWNSANIANYFESDIDEYLRNDYTNGLGSVEQSSLANDFTLRVGYTDRRNQMYKYYSNSSNRNVFLPTETHISGANSSNEGEQFDGVANAQLSLLTSLYSPSENCWLSSTASTSSSSGYVPFIAIPQTSAIINHPTSVGDYSATASLKFRPCLAVDGNTYYRTDLYGKYRLAASRSTVGVDYSVKLSNFEVRPKQARIYANISNGTITTFQICNNANDENPTWENATQGETHVFTNTTKSSSSWAVAVKIVAANGGNQIIKCNEPYGVVCA